MERVSSFVLIEDAYPKNQDASENYITQNKKRSIKWPKQQGNKASRV
jgi:hypothetical protein